jgi:hypothetical protein
MVGFGSESKKRKLAIATAADGGHLYVWKDGQPDL